MKKSFGIIGSPIKHSLSPVLHKYWFDKYNLKADYSIIEAKDNDLSQIINRVRDGSLSGINVTLPFKQKIINHVDKVINGIDNVCNFVGMIFLSLSLLLYPVCPQPLTIALSAGVK